MISPISPSVFQQGSCLAINQLCLSYLDKVLGNIILLYLCHLVLKVTFLLIRSSKLRIND